MGKEELFEVNLEEHLPKVRRIQRRLNPRSFRIMLHLLMKGDHSAQELAEETGLSIHTIRAYIKEMVSATPKLAFIFGWDRDTMGRDCNPRYRFGDGVDMPRRSREGGRERRAARTIAATKNFRMNGRVIRVED